MSLRALIKRSVALTCAYYAFDDWRARARLAKGNLETRSGSRHATLDLETSLAYIDRVYRDYLAYGEIQNFDGTAAEIGPGDNFGVALRILGDGAEAVHAIDRWVSQRDGDAQRRIYEAMSERWDLGRLFDGAPAENTIRGLVYHAGQPAESFFRTSGLRFDAVISRAVLEHLYDPLGALDDMAAALEPGGIMIHRIDLRDHGMFAGHHPLTFLTIGETLYGRMTRGAGRPNRVLMPAYRNWLARSGLEGTVRVSRVAGVVDEVGPAFWEQLDESLRQRALDCVHAIRDRLAQRFKALANEDLAVSGCVLVARKRNDGTTH